MKPKMSDSGKNGSKAGMWVGAVEEKALWPETGLLDHAEAKPMSDERHGQSNRRMWEWTEDRGGRAKDQRRGCHHIPHTTFTPLTRQTEPRTVRLIVSCFLKITCRKYDVPHTPSRAVWLPDGLAVWIQWCSRTVPARINPKTAYFLKSWLEATEKYRLRYFCKRWLLFFKKVNISVSNIILQN